MSQAQSKDDKPTIHGMKDGPHIVYDLASFTTSREECIKVQSPILEENYRYGDDTAIELNLAWRSHL